MNVESRNNPEKLNFDIELATLEDLESIQDLNKKLFEYEIEHGFDDNIDPEWSQSQEGKKELQERITSDNSISLVSKKDGKVIGYLIGLIRNEETGRKDSRYVEIEHMFVDEAERGGGIGEKLVEEFKKWVKRHGLKRVKVNVSYKNQKAIDFYKKVGLVPIDVTMSGEVEE